MVSCPHLLNATALQVLALATLVYALLCGTWLGFLLFILTDQAPGRID
jgi:hypothetical protein